MKKIIIVFALVIFLPVFVQCADGPYVSGNLGLSMVNDSDLTGQGATGTMEFDTGFACSIAVGNDFGNGGRIEGEIIYHKSDYDKLSVTVPGVGSASNITVSGDATSTAFLLNEYYDFMKGSDIRPFIGAGIGLAKVEAGDISLPGYGTLLSSDDDTVFAYQFSAGVGFAMNEKVFLDLKYRYFGTSDPNFEVLDAEFSSHNLFTGIRISFK